VREDEVIQAFSRFGVKSYKFLRQSQCAFVDFHSPVAAADAKVKPLDDAWAIVGMDIHGPL
jgi:hypothetical protein